MIWDEAVSASCSRAYANPIETNIREEDLYPEHGEGSLAPQEMFYSGKHEQLHHDAVFISDLHLHPDEALIYQRFQCFITWAAYHTQIVYVLGDLFHAWPGDDALDAWSKSIAARFAWLNQQGVQVYYLHGNRDFLLGKRFFALARIHCLQEPANIALSNTSVLLVHGDRYCTRDRAHQRWRSLTRHRLFKPLFLSLPLAWRLSLVNRVRMHSQRKNTVSDIFDVVPKVLIHHAQQCQVNTIIHGHTHKPGLIQHQSREEIRQYVLSDWDDNPKVLCYHYTKGFYFVMLD